MSQAMNFNQAFTEAFCSRFEDERTLEPLTSCAEYQMRREAVEAVLETGGGNTFDNWQAVLELLDIVSQFYYRAGVRDGASIATDSFLIPV